MTTERLGEMFESDFADRHMWRQFSAHVDWRTSDTNRIRRWEARTPIGVIRYFNKSIYYNVHLFIPVVHILWLNFLCTLELGNKFVWVVVVGGGLVCKPS